MKDIRRRFSPTKMALNRIFENLPQKILQTVRRDHGQGKDLVYGCKGKAFSGIYRHQRAPDP
jgi:hypothetical protein